MYLIRDQGTDSDKAVARDAGIFDTLGYHEYSNQDDLVRRLTSNIDPEPLSFSLKLDHRAPVYLVDPPVKGLAATAMISRVKKARYRYRSFIPGEDVRLSATDAIRQVALSSGVIVAIEDPEKPHAQVHNVRSLFVAGLADGMGKPLIVLCPAGTDAPLDVRDEVQHYRDEDDIAHHVAELALEVTDHLQQETQHLLRPHLLVLRQSRHFVLGRRIADMNRLLHGHVNLAVGRKGSGKTQCTEDFQPLQGFCHELPTRKD